MEYEIINIKKTAFEVKGDDNFNTVSAYCRNILNEKYVSGLNIIMISNFEKHGGSLIISEKYIYLEDKS